MVLLNKLPPIRHHITTTSSRRNQFPTSRFHSPYVLRNNRNCTRRMGELPEINDKYVKPKVVLFYKNGDRNFRGYHVTVTPRRFKNFDNLLSELTRVTSLPQGVRFIFTPDNGKRVVTLDELSDGRSYVCGSYPKLKKINYGCAPDGSNRKLDASRHFIPSRAATKLTVESSNPPTNIKPKIITVVRNGYSRPRKCVKVLLNKRTAQSYEQVLNDITSSVGVDGGSGVRKLYNINGKLVLSLTELFTDDNTFIAVGNEKFKPSDLDEVLVDLGINTKITHSKSDSRLVAASSTPTSSKSVKKEISKTTKKRGSKHEGNMQSVSLKRQPLPDINHKNSGSSCISAKDANNDKNFDRNEESYEHVVFEDHKIEVDENNNNIEYELENHDKSDNDLNDENDSQSILSKSNTTKSSGDDTNSTTSESKNSAQSLVNSNNKVRDSSLAETDRLQPSLPSLSLQPKTLDSQNQTIKKLSANFNDSDEIYEKYDISQKLGDGNFAVVKIATDKTTGEKYAIKIIDSAKIEGKEGLLKNEIKIQRNCSHPNIVQLYHDFHSPTYIFLVMELVTGGDFFDLVATNTKFEEDEAGNYVRDLCSALDYLHQRNIVHRDIKPENLMVCENSFAQRIIKLADFGLAMKVIQPIFTICGTPTYVAPEILMEKGYGLEVDVWAAGVIIYIMLCGFPPFRSPNRKQTELFDLIETGKFEFLEPYWDDISDSAKDLISKLLVVDVEKRMKAKDVFKHPWLQKFGLQRNNSFESVSSISSTATTVSTKRSVKFKTVATSVHAIQRIKLLLDSRLERNEHFITQIPKHRGSMTSDSEN